jgi:hypothetical protein
VRGLSVKDHLLAIFRRSTPKPTRSRSPSEVVDGLRPLRLTKWREGRSVPPKRKVKHTMATVAEHIERCRPTSGESAHSFPDDWARYERNALVGLHNMGVENLGDVVTMFATAPDAQRFTAWLYDSLVWTIARIREGRNHEAFRGFLQVTEYYGRRGSFWPDPTTHDATIAIRNHLEKALGR